MYELDLHLNRLATDNRRLLTRAVVLGAGGTDQLIETRLCRGQWLLIHPGVYLVGVGPVTWEERLRAAQLAAGGDAEVSYRAGLVLWGLGGIAAAPVEINVRRWDGPVPAGTIVHRTRRIEPVSIIRGIAVTGVERTLLEAGSLVPKVVIEKAFSTAWRRNLTTPAKTEWYLEHHGGKGRRGTKRLREVVALYAGTDRAAGSDGEVVFLRVLREAGIEEPVRQYPVALPGGGLAVVDFAWTERGKLVEFVGLEVHANSRAHDADTLREDDIKSVGWELRRFAPESLRTRPEDVARRVLRFLGGSTRATD